jgi:hypothetical protein
VILVNQLLRYQLAVRLVEQVPGATLLEVGSGSRGIATFVSERWAITACDRDFGDYGSDRPGKAGRVQRVEGDAAELPFGDRAFDVVVSLDMLEHIPPTQRRRVMSELARVTRRRLVLACPAGGPALAADRRVAARIRRLRGRVPPWLEEHLENGFPEPTQLRDALARFGAARLLPNVSVAAHLRLSAVEHAPLAWSASAAAAAVLAPGVGRAGGAAQALLDAVGGHDREPAYRTFAVLDRAC